MTLGARVSPVECYDGTGHDLDTVDSWYSFCLRPCTESTWTSRSSEWSGHIVETEESECASMPSETNLF